MADISYDKLWGTEIFNNDSAEDKDQDNNLNHLELKVNDTYIKMKN